MKDQDDEENERYFDDLWLLEVGRAINATWPGKSGSDYHNPLDTPDAGSAHFDANVSVSDEWCVGDLDVYVKLQHPCTKTLTVELIGPGPAVGDDNFGAPVATCSEVADGVFQRNWTKATVTWDCHAARGTIDRGGGSA